jgi:hypothetical protein
MMSPGRSGAGQVVMQAALDQAVQLRGDASLQLQVHHSPVSLMGELGHLTTAAGAAPSRERSLVPERRTGGPMASAL